MVHGKNLIYNTCWEDPRLDREAMKLGGDDTVLVITSAGCNALDYVLAGAEHVYAVDVNPRQNALLELKLAAIRTLEFEEFWSLFGQGRWTEFGTAYRRRVRAELSPATAQYWDRHFDFFTGARRSSFYWHGSAGFFAWLINSYLDRIARARSVVEDLLDAGSIEEQARIYERQLSQYLFHRPMKWTLRRDSTMSLLGVPRAQKHQIDCHYQGGMAGYIQDCLATVFGKLPLADNYFWRVYLTGQYTRQCCPEYLREENFRALKNGLADRVSVHTETVARFLECNDVSISRFVLLDHQDWLSHFGGEGELAREWNAIVNRAAEKCRILWRSAGFDSEFVDRVQLSDGTSVGERLTYRRYLADTLHQRDRVHTYGSFHIADLDMA
jgi:S-adenosylmethionine-diacylglycerol 3-amino-3-carboxypropyl transferase